jgi:hypothetical protein
MFAFISYSLPSGVVLYFLVSNAWQIGQQALIFKTMPTPAVGTGGTVAATGSAPKVSPKPDDKPKPDNKPKAENPAPPAEGRFKRALGQAKEAGRGGAQPGGNGDGQSPPKQPPAAGGGNMGRAQPSGSPPRPKKKRR